MLEFDVIIYRHSHYMSILARILLYYMLL